MGSCHVSLFYAILRKNSTFIYIYDWNQNMNIRSAIVKIQNLNQISHTNNRHVARASVRVTYCDDAYVRSKCKVNLYIVHDQQLTLVRFPLIPRENATHIASEPTILKEIGEE
jgi:hypothetical protein